MGEFGKFIIMLWIGMFASVIILTILNAEYNTFRAFVLGIVVFALTIIYMIYGWYCEYKAEHPKVRGQK